MSWSRWVAAWASLFALVLLPDPALAARGSSRAAARPVSAHAEQSSQRRPGPVSRRRRVAARRHTERHAVVLLVLGSGYAQAAGSRRVRGLQRRLAGEGFAPGPIDGRYGPRTRRAVMRFQAAHRLRVDGVVGPVTLARLRVTAPTATGRRRVSLRRAASSRAGSSRSVAARPSTPSQLPRTAPDPARVKSVPGRVRAVPATGSWPVVWLTLAGLVVVGGGLVGVVANRSSRVFPRRRRYVTSRSMQIARLAGFRYCRYRDAYVLRLVGHRFGPVLKTTHNEVLKPSPRPSVIHHSRVHDNRRRSRRHVGR